MVHPHFAIRRASLRAATFPGGTLSTGLLLPLAYRRLASLRADLETQAYDFAERFAAALVPQPTARPAIDAVTANPPRLILNACRRAARTEGQRLIGGIPSLASISVSAPLIGVFGTSIGILGAFRGTTGEKSAILAAIATDLSAALVFTASGLAIGIFAYVVHHALTAKLRALECQMDELSLSLANALRQ